MQFSKNRKNFSIFFFFFFLAFLETTKNFEYFQSKDEPDTWFFSETKYWKMRRYLNA